MQPRYRLRHITLVEVSILTRPGGRVQPEQAHSISVVGDVSILTRPGGRVQRARRGSGEAGCTGFQSSPVPEDGCNNAVKRHAVAPGGVSILTRPGGRVQPAAAFDGSMVVICFNPHPSRRTGATAE